MSTEHPHDPGELNLQALGELGLANKSDVVAGMVRAVNYVRATRGESPLNTPGITDTTGAPPEAPLPPAT